MALTHGRPSHIHEDDWEVVILNNHDFPETSKDENETEGSAAIEQGRTVFCKMMALSEISGNILQTF